MTITELIAALEAIRAEHGDLPVGVSDDGASRFYIGECGAIEVATRTYRSDPERFVLL